MSSDETIKSLNKLNKFLDEKNISFIIFDDLTSGNISKEDYYIVQDKLQCLKGLINEFHRLQHKNSSILINNDEQIEDSEFDNNLKYIYPEFFFSLNYLKNVNVVRLIFEGGMADIKKKVKKFVYFLHLFFLNTFC